MGNITKKPSKSSNNSDKNSQSKNKPGNKPAENSKTDINSTTVGLSDENLQFLVNKTRCSKEEIEKIFHEFEKKCPSGKLNKQDFVSLYCSFRSESASDLKEISENVFNAFDSDNNGYVTFNEFVVEKSFIFSHDI